MTKKKEDAFARVPLWFAAAAAKATGEPAILICTHMLYAAWKAKSSTFRFSTEHLRRYGISRKAKRRVLHDLEAAGLITVEREIGRSPVVTLVVI